jgi:two-component system NtrC family sensor kinase
MPAAASRILVIDDEPMLGQTLRLALQGEHELVLAESAGEALERLERDTGFDLILCDLMMPGGTGGIAVYEAVATQYPHLLTCFVFMTGGAFTGRASEFLQRYRGTTLQKPFSLQELVALVSRLNHRAAAHHDTG